VARGRERRCLNRALDLDVTVMVKMPPYDGAPRPARVFAAPQSDRRSVACTTHVRRHGGERPRCLGRSVGLGKARGLGQRATSGGGASGGARARTPRARARRRGALRGGPVFNLLSLSLNTIYSKNLNRSLSQAGCLLVVLMASASSP
jgi:hypothetical protein